MNYSETNTISLLCESCSTSIEDVEATTTISLNNQVDILGFSANVVCACPKCGDVMTECDKDMIQIILLLRKKHYKVVDYNLCSWGSDLYAPFIKILSGGLVKIIPPKGWKDVTDPSVKSFQVFAPNMSYGCADDGANPLDYAVDQVFKCEEHFDVRKKHYVNRLLRWAEELDLNTTIAKSNNTKGATHPTI